MSMKFFRNLNEYNLVDFPYKFLDTLCTNQRYRTIGLNGPYYGSRLFKGVHIRSDDYEWGKRVGILRFAIEARGNMISRI